MDQRLRARLALHGLAIVVASLVIAIPFAMVFTKGDDEPSRVLAAHLHERSSSGGCAWVPTTMR